MTNEAWVKLYNSNGRFSINLPTVFVRDSTFPFKEGDKMHIKIDKESSKEMPKLIIDNQKPLSDLFWNVEKKLEDEA